MMELRGLADRVPTIQHTSALQVSFGVGSERRSARQLVELSEKGGSNSEADSQAKARTAWAPRAVIRRRHYETQAQCSC